MATNTNITLVKGAFSITLQTTRATENWKNILKVVPGVTSKDNQVNDPNKSQVVDLQRTTYSYVIECFITATSSPVKTAKQVKDDLRTVFEGARTNGGAIVLTYEDSSINVFFEDCVVIKISNDDAPTGYSGDDSTEYQVTLTLVEGEEV